MNLEYFPNHSFNELTDMMPRLKDLGIKAIHLIPIFECFGTAQYLIIDQDKINPRHGTPAGYRILSIQ